MASVPGAMRGPGRGGALPLGTLLVLAACVSVVRGYVVAAPRALVPPGGRAAASAGTGLARPLDAPSPHGRAVTRPVRAGAFPWPQRAAPQTARSALSTDVEGAVELKEGGSDRGSDQHTPDFKARSRRSEGDRLDDLAMQAAKSADMGIRYDPARDEAEFSGRTFDVWRRDLQISVPLTSFLGQVLIDFQRGVEKENRPLRARQFMEIIAGLGPAFIKAGQALSSRPDLLPPEYLRELQKLQDRLPPFPNHVAFAIIEEQLGVPMSEVFERVERVW